MGGNSIGSLFRVTTWGESHGEALGVVIDGCPPGLELSDEDIQIEMDKRKPNQGFGTSARKETDRVRILSGVFEGRTTGTPISIILWNEDVDSTPYDAVRTIYRPGQADFTYQAKYGIRDYRGGGRASARETAARVAAGAVAKKILQRKGIELVAYTVELGGIRAEKRDLEAVKRNFLRCPDEEVVPLMEKKIETAKLQGDTVGGIVEILIRGCPAGLGDPVFDKLEADLAKGLMSIGAVRGVEVGAGFGVSQMLGSQCNDPMGPEGFLKNDAGGILGGISTGENILLRVSEMVCELPWIAELDINPLLVDEHGAMVADARITIAPRAPSADRYSHMAIHPYPSHLVSQWQLPNGADVTIRPIRPEDAEMTQSFVRGLSEETKYFRFMDAVRELSPAMLVRLTQIDYDREMALLAVTEQDGREVELGVARYATNPDRTSCEFAVVVHDQWQHQGIG
ncbi:MAG: chorismate synthase, partial [candidate division WOR-3 bacterium]